MAEILVQPTAAGGGNAIGGLKGMIDFLTHAWPWILVCAVIIILAVVIFYLLNKLEDERKERDEPGYQLFKTVKMACELNADTSLIRKSFNPATLPLIFLPIFGWILMAIIKKEHSAKIVDYQNALLGYYRGAYISQDNTWNFLIYKERWLLFFEKSFVLKCPLGVKFKKQMKDDKGKTKVSSDGKTVLYEDEEVSFRPYITRLPNGDFKIHATGMEQVGMYYKCPVYIIEDKNEVVDLRKFLEGAIIDNTYQIMTTRLLNTAAKQMEKGMMFSPDLQFRKQAPMKTKEEEQLDQYESK